VSATAVPQAAGRLTVFDQVSLDGAFSSPTGDIEWAHKAPDDAEWNAFVSGNASGGGMLVFGRKTYEMMASFWPTPEAHAQMPVVAERMNALPKVVFSRTLASVAWQNTRLVKSYLVGEIRRLKREGSSMAVLGSGTVVAQLVDAGLVDLLQIVVNPVALGGGRSLFAGLGGPRSFALVASRVFANGSVALSYAPA